ncbi:MAG: ABC transporter ATP-binding protein [Deltaproteobacteria bacterium]|jgi:lipoprotein-releasing system ATP-binding protein|nr:ABC transporter ATP-binding protein [Deltaproteobacteria bacterium]
MNEPQVEPVPLMEVGGLVKTFRSGSETLSVLDGLDLTLERGVSAAVVGSSGSGKSTLLHLLGGLDRPSGGRILSKGRDLMKFSEPELSRWRAVEVGFVFQFHHLLAEFDALENVSLPGRIIGLSRAEAEGRAEPILRRVGLGQRLRHRPGTLSGGEQQRVALARALALAPPLLLADEPTGNLDAVNAAMVNELIAELTAEMAMSAVVVTHSVKLARKMSRALELAEGRLRPWSGLES